MDNITDTVVAIEEREKLSSTTLARVIVAQALYSFQIDGEQKIDAVIQHCIEESNVRDSKVKKFSVKLASFIVEEDESINFVISKYIKNHRKIEDMPVLLLSILKAAIGEILMDEKTDKAIIINEYINVTSSFYTKKEAGFINAVLDKYLSEIK